MIFRIAKGLWVAATILVLLVTLYAYDGTPNSDIEVLLTWSMIFLTFPGGLIFAGLFVIAADCLDKFFAIVLHTSYLSLVLSWAGFLLFGYLQWFKLVPSLVRKIKARMEKSNRPSTTTQ